MLLDRSTPRAPVIIDCAYFFIYDGCERLATHGTFSSGRLTKKLENRLVPYAVHVHCNYMAGIGFYCSGLRFVPMSAFATSTGGTSSPLLCRDIVQDSLTNKLVLLSLTGEHHECCATVYTVLLCPCGYHPVGTRSRSDIDVCLEISPVQLIDACELHNDMALYLLHFVSD